MKTFLFNPEKRKNKPVLLIFCKTVEVYPELKKYNLISIMMKKQYFPWDHDAYTEKIKIIASVSNRTQLCNF